MGGTGAAVPGRDGVRHRRCRHRVHRHGAGPGGRAVRPAEPARHPGGVPGAGRGGGGCCDRTGVGRGPVGIPERAGHRPALLLVVGAPRTGEPLGGQGGGPRRMDHRWGRAARDRTGGAAARAARGRHGPGLDLDRAGGSGGGATAGCGHGRRDAQRAAGRVLRARPPVHAPGDRACPGGAGHRHPRRSGPGSRRARHLRQRLQADGKDHSLELFDLDAAGERLWIDESLPGARTTEVRAADVAAGQLPDFGGEGSPFQAPPQDGQSRGHEIPDSITGLRER